MQTDNNHLIFIFIAAAKIFKTTPMKMFIFVIIIIYLKSTKIIIRILCFKGVLFRNSYPKSKL